MTIYHKPKKYLSKDGLNTSEVDNIGTHLIDWQNSKAYMTHVLEGHDLYCLGDIRKVLETEGIDGLYRKDKIGVTCVSEILKCMEYFYPNLKVARPETIVHEQKLYSYMPIESDKQSLDDSIRKDIN